MPVGSTAIGAEGGFSALRRTSLGPLEHKGIARGFRSANRMEACGFVFNQKALFTCCALSRYGVRKEWSTFLLQIKRPGTSQTNMVEGCIFWLESVSVFHIT